MARRIKEAEEVHKERISSAAQALFEKNGIQHTTVDDIAKIAGYSKATLYVYFENKTDIVNYITLKSMELLYEKIKVSAENIIEIKEAYYKICWSLADFQKQSPFCFELILDEIELNTNHDTSNSLLTKIYNIGEKINALTAKLLEQGIKQSIFRNDIDIFCTVMILWSCISGIIKLAVNKSKYIFLSSGMTEEKFMQYGFEQIFRTIEKGDH